MKNFGIFSLFIIGFILSVLLGGYMFKTYYEWFIVPIYHVPIVTIEQAIGISFFLNYLHPIKIELKNKEDNNKSEKEKRKPTADDYFSVVGQIVGRTLGLLGFAWLILHYLIQ